MVTEQPLARSFRRRGVESAGLSKRRPDSINLHLRFFTAVKLHTSVNDDNRACTVPLFEDADEMPLCFTVFGEDKNLFFLTARAFLLDVVNQPQKLVQFFIASDFQGE